MSVVGMGPRYMLPSLEEAGAVRPRSRRGFASMSLERRREIAAKGGASVPADKRSFSKNRELAAEAGRKGGSTSHGGGRPSGKKKN